MKKQGRKVIATVVAAIVAVTMALPALAYAKGNTYIEKGIKILVQNTGSDKKVWVSGLTKNYKNRKSLVIPNLYVATGENAGNYYVSGIKSKAFTGSKATKITINSKKVVRIYPNTYYNAAATNIVYKPVADIMNVRANAFNGSKVKVLTLNAKTVKFYAGAFKGAKSTNLTIKIQSKSLKKASVKNMFKGYTKAKKITIKVPKAKVKAYKKIFTRANTGAKKGTKIVVKAL